MNLKINVLGTEYSVHFRDYEALRIFKDKGIDGYCDNIDKMIVVCNMKTHPKYYVETEEYCHKIERLTLRHEIVHAFLNESGLQESTLQFEEGWATNEEMVDWIAAQFPKMVRAMKEAGCLED